MLENITTTKETRVGQKSDGANQYDHGMVQRTWRRSKRQHLAWWPVHSSPDKWGNGTPFSYRPGQLMVLSSELPRVENALTALGVQYERPIDEQPRPVSRLMVHSPEPIPVLVRRLHQRGDMGPQVVAPNHVFWPTAMSLPAAPWLSGGEESRPVEATTPPQQLTGSRGSTVTVAQFDSGLLPDWSDGTNARWWLGAKVVPARPGGLNSPDVEGRGGDPDPLDLDIYDSHATFVAGIQRCAAPEVTVLNRNVLSEMGEVDEATLCSAIRSTIGGTAKLVNLSLGGTSLGNNPPVELTNLVEVEFPGVVFVAAAGNNGPNGDPIWPAALPSVVGVGALTTSSPPEPAPFSNVVSADVWAPGADVLNAFGRGWLDYPGGPHKYTTGLATWSGTSFAAPLVTAVLCDYLAASSSISGADAIDWLNTTYPVVSGRVIVTA
jgi:Subtilase family